jgi:hypothetical protein
VRQAKLSRFTIDRMMTMLAGLGQRVEISVDVRPRRRRTTRRTLGATKASQPHGKKTVRARSHNRAAP